MSITERVASPDVAERWIRESLGLDLGAELTVTGSCMEPVLAEGQRIRLMAVNSPLRVGDVVLLRTSNGLRLHRVVLRLIGAVRTKGDRGSYLDPSTPDAAVLAVWESTESFLARRVRVLLSLSRLFLRARGRSPQPSSVR